MVRNRYRTGLYVVFLIALSQSKRRRTDRVILSYNSFADSQRKNLPFKERLIQEYALFCGSDKLCATRGGSSNISTPLLTCGDCSCERSCVVYNNCCPDYEPKIYGPKPEAVECVALSMELTFYTVVRCPADFTDSVISELCFKNVDIKTPPVLSSSTGITYKNVFCAICNEDSNDLKPWLPRYECHLANAILSARIMEDNCILQIQPPVNHTSDVVPCRSPLVSECHTTGNMEYYDDFLYAACHSFESPAGDYRNVFCGFCDLNPAVFKVIGKKTWPGLNVIFKISPATGPGLRNVTDDGSAVYDVFTDSYRKLYCADDKVLVSSTCVSVYNSSIGRQYEMDLYLVPLDRTNAEGDFYKDIISRFMDALEERINSTAMCKFNLTVHTDINIIEGSPGLSTNQLSLIKVSAIISSDRHHDVDEWEQSLITLRTGTLNLKRHNESHIFQTYTPFNMPNISTYTIKGVYQSQIILVYDNTSFEIANDSTSVTDLLQCPQIHLIENEFEITSESVVVKLCPSTITLLDAEYSVINESVLVICLSDFLRYVECVEDNSKLDFIISVVSLSVSMFCLALTILTFSFFRSLRTLAGKNTMSLCISLFCAQGLFLFINNSSSGAISCAIIGMFIHYAWLTTFAWMNACSYYMFSIFCGPMKSKGIATNDMTRFCLYVAYANGAPLLVVIATIVGNMLDSSGTFSGYGGEICYLNGAFNVGLAFALPAGLVLTANCGFFLKSVYAIRSVPENILQNSSRDRHYNSIYIKLSTLTGATWIFSFLVEATGVQALSLIFVVLNGGQGLFIFLSYVANRRVQRMYRDLCRRKHTQATSSFITSSTSMYKSQSFNKRLTKPEDDNNHTYL